MRSRSAVSSHRPAAPSNEIGRRQVRVHTEPNSWGGFRIWRTTKGAYSHPVKRHVTYQLKAPIYRRGPNGLSALEVHELCASLLNKVVMEPGPHHDAEVQWVLSVESSRAIKLQSLLLTLVPNQGARLSMREQCED